MVSPFKMQDVCIVQIACGDAHTVALSREGVLYSWGGGGCGQLGHSETSKMWGGPEKLFDGRRRLKQDETIELYDAIYGMIGMVWWHSIIFNIFQYDIIQDITCIPCTVS